MRRPHALSRDVTVDTESPPPRPPPPLTVGLAGGCQEAMGVRPSSPSPDSLSSPLPPVPPEAPSSLRCPASHGLRPLPPKPHSCCHRVAGLGCSGPSGSQAGRIERKPVLVGSLLPDLSRVLSTYTWGYRVQAASSGPEPRVPVSSGLQP